MSKNKIMSGFKLHPRLEQDCLTVGQMTLCTLMLMNDSQYPWYILVPSRPDINEIYQLAITDQQALLAESSLLAEKLQLIYRPDKLNIATIGNLVPQLHMHHIVRYQKDSTWPAPVWGKLPALPYSEPQAEAEISRMRMALQAYLIDY
ncbi:HIT domain-containing protein [Methylomonas sp. AM2-LC]|uniref:HIT domain-containing protein n=1 Tax=Methylomonas sp. AM2-LC TaxID=3153301 RepID=UPI003267184E